MRKKAICKEESQGSVKICKRFITFIIAHLWCVCAGFCACKHVGRGILTPFIILLFSAFALLPFFIHRSMSKLHECDKEEKKVYGEAECAVKFYFTTKGFF